MSFRKPFLGRLAAASLALGAGAANASGAAPALSADILAEWVEVELDGDPEKTPLAVVNCADRAAARARAVIGHAWPHAKDAGESLLRELSRDDSSAARIAAAAGLGRILELSAPAERIEIVCRWTMSENPQERTAIARALALPTPVFVADLAIVELARDPSAEVRAAAVGALRTHFHSDPRGLGEIAAALARDTDPAVRNAVRNLLADTAS